MLDSKETRKVLEKFAKYVIQQSRSNLTRNNTNATKELYNNFDSEINASKNSIEVKIINPKYKEYGKFVDRGVKGTQSGSSLDGYKYTNKKPPVSAFIKWARVKPIKPRDRATGRFITNKQFGFIMQNHIFKHGIKPTKFLTTPFQRAFNNLPDELLEAYGLDLEDFIKFTLDIKK